MSSGCHHDVIRIPSTPQFLHDIIRMGCEMLGVGEDGEESNVARVSIVNHAGEVLLDSFVAVAEPVTDYRTEFSGVRQEDLEGAPDFETVRNKVKDLLTGKLLVGHGLDHDMDVLSLYPYITPAMVRDTSKYQKFLSTSFGYNGNYSMIPRDWYLLYYISLWWTIISDVHIGTWCQ